MEFREFPKMARLSRDVIVTEKIDGTNAQIAFGEDGVMWVGSRNQWITPEKDNFGFAAWATANREELAKLGPGRHYGEWWGRGVQRGYDLKERRFSLFNVNRWSAPDAVLPACCHLVPVLYRGLFATTTVEYCLAKLQSEGSQASPGFMKPEGVVVFHLAGQVGFKKTLDKDDAHKTA